MKSKTILNRRLLLSAVMLSVTLPAFADRDEGRHGGERHEHDRGEWRGGEMRHFEHEDIHVWRGGRWVHDWHDGRLGWWWLTGGWWYFYPEPVYPYPDPYTPPVVIQQQAPVVAAPQTTTQVWYYCEASKGYYPYVATCPSGWKTVAPTPPATPAAPADLPAQSR